MFNYVDTLTRIGYYRRQFLKKSVTQRRRVVVNFTYISTNWDEILNKMTTLKYFSMYINSNCVFSKTVGLYMGDQENANNIINTKLKA